jgi:hypothetical protein
MNFILLKFLEKNNIIFLKEISAFASLAFQFIILLATFFLMRIN